MRFKFLLFILIFFSFISIVSAHEAYVLPASQFNAGLRVFAQNPFAPLVDATHLKIFIFIAVLVILSYFLALWLATTKESDWLDKQVRKAALIGPLIIRLAVSASFFYSAISNVILGPELPLDQVVGGVFIRFLLFVLAFMILTGTLTELAGAISILLYFYICHYFGLYMLTYTNYFGEFLVLFLFGSRFLSFDHLFFGERRWLPKIENKKWLETPVVRILYGVALTYAGYTIKFLHQQLTIDVYDQYHLVNFFHASAGFIAAGAGLAEITIGLFIVFGFMMRWTILISLVFITLSIMYFQELLWPHFILYGISLSLLINSGDRWTLDHYLVPWARTIFHRLWRHRFPSYNKPEEMNSA